MCVHHYMGMSFVNLSLNEHNHRAAMEMNFVNSSPKDHNHRATMEMTIGGVDIVDGIIE